MANGNDLLLELRKPNIQEKAYRKYIDMVQDNYTEKEIAMARVTTIAFSKKDLQGKDLHEEIENHFKESICQGKRLFK